jgi:hypothetical protein
VRCPHCGSENSTNNLFCGMCGKALDEPVTAPPAAEGPARAQSSHPAEPERQEPAAPAPAYTGGLFNLGAPAERPSGNLDYLLEDDEPRSRKGLVIGLIALALVAGLGYLRWRHGTLPFVNLLKSAPKAQTQTAESPPAPAPSVEVTAPAPSPTPPAEEPAAPTNNPAASAALAPEATAPASTPSTPLPAPAEQPSAESKPAGAPAATTSTSEALTSPDGDQPAASPAPAPSTTAEAAPVAPAPKPAKPKPSPKALPPTRPEDSVAMGERYLYGRGVPQDCTRGLRYVKPAADQSNPKAMITMGALYATGHCLSRDLPTAYRYFALALRKDPENGPLAQNAKMVWAQMTEAERQQAIRMTQ